MRVFVDDGVNEFVDERLGERLMPLARNAIRLLEVPTQVETKVNLLTPPSLATPKPVTRVVLGPVRDHRLLLQMNPSLFNWVLTASKRSAMLVELITTSNL